MGQDHLETGQPKDHIYKDLIWLLLNLMKEFIDLIQLVFNLIIVIIKGMGVLPTCFVDGQSAESLGLTGKERFSVDLNKGNL